MITQTGNYSHSLLFGFKNIFLEQTNVCWVGEFVLELKAERACELCHAKSDAMRCDQVQVLVCVPD